MKSGIRVSFTFIVLRNCGVAGSFFILLFFLTGCGKKGTVDGHPAFTKTVTTQLNLLPEGNIPKRFAFIDSLFKLVDNPGPGDVFVKDSIKEIKYLIHVANYQQALHLQDTMLAICADRLKEEKYAVRYAVTLYERSEAYARMKRYTEALHYISQAEETALRYVKNKCSLIDLSAKKPYLMFAQEKYLESAAYFKIQYQNLMACQEDLYTKQRCLNNIGLCYLKVGQLDSAEKYEAAALQVTLLAKKTVPSMFNSFSTAEAVIYGDQAEVASLRGNYAAAEMLFKRCIDSTLVPDIGYAQNTMARLGTTLLQQHKTSDAKQILATLKSSLDTFPNEQQLVKWYALSAEMYKQENEPAEALAYLQAHQHIKDSLQARDKEFGNIDLGKAFENLELKYNNDLLKQDAKLKNLYLTIALFVVLIAAGITGFVWYSLKHTRKLHLQVQQKNKDLQKVLSSLEQSHQENTRIIRIVAHDLKNPISAINNLIFSLLRKNHPEELKEIFEIIKTACVNSMALIKDVLSNAKAPGELGKDLVNMKSLLEYCVGLLQAKADEKNQKLNLDAEDALLFMNRQKMWRVVSNIVNNAIKFSPENTAIDIKLQRNNQSVLLSVHDRGIGIPPELTDKIFSHSPEITRQGTNGEESYGMGLSISQQIVEEHNGKIWFNSSNGKGSVFYVELPVESESLN